MDEQTLKWLAQKTVAIIGFSKNAGKTTTLNYLLNISNFQYRRIGLTSIGRDGEEYDVSSGFAKPNIFVKRGTIFATTSELLSSCDVTKKILASTNYSTPMGDVYIVECMSDGNVQIAGPSMVSQMAELKKLFFQIGVDCLFIDGAASRKSLGNGTLADGVIFCVSANSGSDLDKVVEEMVFTAECFSLPTAKEDKSSLYFGGIITDKIIDEIIIKIFQTKYFGIIFDDPFKIMCSRNHFLKLKRICNNIKVLTKPKLLAITVNPTSIYGWQFDSDIFIYKIKESVDVQVFNVMGGE